MISFFTKLKNRANMSKLAASIPFRSLSDCSKISLLCAMSLNLSGYAWEAVFRLV